MKQTQLTRIALAAALAAGLATSATAAGGAGQTESRTGDKATMSSTKANQGQAYRALTASNIIGKSVRGENGKNVGQVEDLVVNLNDGKVRYAILSFDPGIFEGEDLYAIPIKELRMSADGDDLDYTLSRDRLKQASMKRDEWDSERNDGAILRRVDKAYGVVQPSKTARAFRASDLIGEDVEDRSGKDIGEIKDLVINMTEGKVHYAALSFDNGFARPDRSFAVPLSSFKLVSNDDDDLRFDVDKSTVQSMKEIASDRWGSLNDKVWVADVDQYLITVVQPAGNASRASDKNSGMKKGSDAQTSQRGIDAGPKGESPNQMFTRLDKDQDQYLSEDEAGRSGEVKAAWGDFDKNGDGRISRSEFVTHDKAAKVAG